MDVINCQEVAPKYYYIFINRNNKKFFNQSYYNNYLLSNKIITNGIANSFHNEIKRTNFINGDIAYLPFIRNNVLIQCTSPFMFRIINRYNIEHNLEYFRQNEYKTYPSRLSGIYAFGDIDSCKKISNDRNWKIEDVKKFKLEDIEINKYAKIVKCNFKMIGLMEHIDLPAFPQDEQEKIYYHYWNGGGDFKVLVPTVDDINGKEVSCGTLYEFIIEGILEEVSLTVEEQSQLKIPKEK